MMALALTVFLFVLLGICGAILGCIMIYRRQEADYAITVDKIQRLNTDLLKDIRFEGATQLRKTQAGRELLALLQQEGELPIDDEWSNVGYRQQRRSAARKNEIASRYRNVTAMRMVARRKLYRKNPAGVSGVLKDGM